MVGNNKCSGCNNSEPNFCGSSVAVTELKVTGMSCQHCVMSVKKSVGNLAGVKNVDVDLESGLVTVTHDPENPTPEKIKETIRDAGYDLAQ